MIDSNARNHLVSRLPPRLAAAVVALSLVGAAVAQNAPDPQSGVAPATDPPTQAAPPPPPPPVPPPPQQSQQPPGMFAAIGRWVDGTIGSVTTGLGDLGGQAGEAAKGAAEAAKGAADAAKDAAATVVRFPATSIVTGRKACTRTASGGPDCTAATDALCRSKGYTTGTSLHVQSEQKCPVWGWISGQKPVGKCGTETYVTSAMCR